MHFEEMLYSIEWPGLSCTASTSQIYLQLVHLFAYHLQLQDGNLSESFLLLWIVEELHDGVIGTFIDRFMVSWQKRRIGARSNGVIQQNWIGKMS